MIPLSNDQITIIRESLAQAMSRRENEWLEQRAEGRSPSQDILPVSSLPDKVEPASRLGIDFVRRPHSVALERYLSSSEDYVSLRPDLSVNTEGDIDTMNLPFPEASPFSGAVGRSGRPEVMNTSVGPSLSVVRLLTSVSPAPQLASSASVPASVPQLVQHLPESVSHPASESFSPDAFFIYQQNNNNQKSRLPNQHAPITEHGPNNLPLNNPDVSSKQVPRQTPSSRFTSSVSSVPAEPRAMRGVARLQTQTPSQARITEVTRQQEPVSSMSEEIPLQVHGLQAHVQGLSMIEDTSLKSQQTELYGEIVSTQDQYTHARSQRANTMQIPPRRRPGAIFQESVHTRNRSLYSKVPQYYTSRLGREVQHASSDIKLLPSEGTENPTTAEVQSSPISGQPKVVNRQLFRSPFEGQAEATVQSQPVLSTIVDDSTIREQSHLLKDGHRNPQLQAEARSAGVRISPVHDQSVTGLSNRNFPALQSQAGIVSIDFYNASVRGNAGTEFPNPHVPTFHGNPETGLSNPCAPAFHGRALPGYPNVYSTPVRGDQPTGFGSPYVTPSHGQTIADYPSTYASPFRAGQATRSGLPHTSASQNQVANSYPSFHISPVRGDQALRFGNLRASPSNGQAPIGHQDIHSSQVRGDLGIGHGNPYTSPFPIQAVTAPTNFQADGYPGAEIGNQNHSPFQGQQVSGSANIHSHGVPGTNFTYPQSSPFQGHPVHAAPTSHESPVQGTLEAGLAKRQVSPTRALDPRSVSFHVPPRGLQVSPTRALDPRSVSFHAPPRVGAQENCFHWMTYGKCSADFGPCPYAHPTEKPVDVPDLNGPTHYETGHLELRNVEDKAEEPLTVGPKAMSQPHELYGYIIALVSKNTKLQAMVKAPSKAKKVGNKPLSVGDSLNDIKEKIKDYVEQFAVYGVVITKGLPKLLDYGPILSLTLQQLNESELQLQQLAIIDRCSKAIREIVKRQRVGGGAGTKVATTMT